MSEQEQDRTVLANRWAAAVAEVDEMEDALKYARNREHAAWEALESSRAKTVKSLPPPPPARRGVSARRGGGRSSTDRRTR